MTTRTLRRLQGITYWIINDQNEIRRFINTNVKAEWKRDNQKDGVDSRKDDWLLSLPKRKWHTSILDISKVRLDPETMAREGFTTRLEERSKEMGRSISEYQVAIWPLVIGGEDYMLRDGYCRFMTLRGLGVSKVMAYVGVSRPVSRV